jgi:SAM-dependent methyltransferase
MMAGVSTPRATPAHFVREKLERDLSDPVVYDEVRDDQIAYYRARAPWYDDCYTRSGDYDSGPERNAQWLGDMARIEAALAAAPMHGNCVELGAGTGYWTARVVDRVERLWLLDAVSEMLAIAGHRLAARADRIAFEVVDLWHWQPEQIWDSALACFFFEHVPDEVLPTLLGALHDALRPGACVFFAEAAAQDREPQIEARPIGDRTYQVVERRRTEEEFGEAFGAAGFSVDVTDGPRFVHGVATRNGR